MADVWLEGKLCLTVTPKAKNAYQWLHFGILMSKSIRNARRVPVSKEFTIAEEFVGHDRWVLLTLDRARKNLTLHAGPHQTEPFEHFVLKFYLDTQLVESFYTNPDGMIAITIPELVDVIGKANRLIIERESFDLSELNRLVNSLVRVQ